MSISLNQKFYHSIVTLEAINIEIRIDVNFKYRTIYLIRKNIRNAPKMLF